MIKLTEEEQKAIEYLQAYISNDKKDIEILNSTIDEDIDYYTEVEPIQKRVKYSETIESIIEKQQKEIEEFKIKFKEWIGAETQEKLIEKLDCIPKDKIREKIDTLEKYILKTEEETCGRCITIGEDMCIRYLKELLEEG